MGPRRRREEVGRLLRARIEDPVDDPAFTRELAARARTAGQAPRRRSRAAVIAVAVVAPALVLGSLGVAYGTGLVRAPWHPRDVPARVPSPPVPTHSSSPTEQPTRSASTDPSPSPSPGGDDLTSSPSSTPSGVAPSATPTRSASATASPTTTTSPRPTKTPTSPRPTKTPKPGKPTKTPEQTPQT